MANSRNKLIADVHNKPARGAITKADIADANKLADASAKRAKPASKRGAATKPAATHHESGRRVAFVKQLIGGASDNEAKQLRNRLRAAFAAFNGGVKRGSWQAYDNGRHNAKLRVLLKSDAGTARKLAAEIVADEKLANKKPARVAKPRAKPAAIVADTSDVVPNVEPAAIVADTSGDNATS